MAGFVGSPEPFEKTTDDWYLYAQQFEHFLLANSVVEDSESKWHHLLLAFLMSNSTFNKLLANLVGPKKPGEFLYKKIVNN